MARFGDANFERLVVSEQQARATAARWRLVRSTQDDVVSAARIAENRAASARARAAERAARTQEYSQATRLLGLSRTVASMAVGRSVQTDLSVYPDIVPSSLPRRLWTGEPHKPVGRPRNAWSVVAEPPVVEEHYRSVYWWGEEVNKVLEGRTVHERNYALTPTGTLLGYSTEAGLRGIVRLESSLSSPHEIVAASVDMNLIERGLARFVVNKGLVG